MALLLVRGAPLRSTFVLFTSRSRPFHLIAAHSSSGGGVGRASEGTVTLGDVTLPLKEPEAAELVPTGYLTALWDRLPQSHLRHIKWLMQKEAIGQDVFLIGPPGK